MITAGMITVSGITRVNRTVETWAMGKLHDYGSNKDQCYAALVIEGITTRQDVGSILNARKCSPKGIAQDCAK